MIKLRRAAGVTLLAAFTLAGTIGVASANYYHYHYWYHYHYSHHYHSGHHR